MFGKSVIENQYVHYRLAELQTEIELLRALTYRLTAQVNHLFLISVIYPRFQHLIELFRNSINYF